MSLKITNADGFVIGGVLNPSIDTIYVRCNVDMNKQKPIIDENDVITEVSISTNAKTTIEGNLFDTAISVDGISPMYWLNYDVAVTDMNAQYLEIETDLKEKLEANNPGWTITIVTIPIV
jgi:hypothetical protein